MELPVKQRGVRVRKIYSFRILDFKRARDVRARAQGDREESLPRELPMKARLVGFIHFIHFPLVGYRFSFSLSFARARERRVQNCVLTFNFTHS